MREIQATLDAKGYYQGCYFMPAMAKHCGRRLRVLKPVRFMYDECTHRALRFKETVLLEGALCEGHIGRACDRSCYFFWKEAWLERAEG
jgi:hypothetical protein